jgi:TPP-dependent pyruvate/acetoin dehydrogenase alpha subunit
MYEDMLKIRLWESKVKDLLLAGGFRGVAHLYVGEEAIAVGVCHALRKDDYIASTHRGHGHLIAKGGDLGRMLAEITHKATGYCKGYGGSLDVYLTPWSLESAFTSSCGHMTPTEAGDCTFRRGCRVDFATSRVLPSW